MNSQSIRSMTTAEIGEWLLFDNAAIRDGATGPHRHKCELRIGAMTDELERREDAERNSHGQEWKGHTTDATSHPDAPVI